MTKTERVSGEVASFALFMAALTMLIFAISVLGFAWTLGARLAESL